MDFVEVDVPRFRPLPPGLIPAAVSITTCPTPSSFVSIYPPKREKSQARRNKLLKIELPNSLPQNMANNQSNPTEELKKLQNQVNALQDLLLTFQQNQLQQAQALSAFLSSNPENKPVTLERPAPNLPTEFMIPRKPPPVATSAQTLKISTSRHSSVSQSHLSVGDIAPISTTFHSIQRTIALDDELRSWCEIYKVKPDELSAICAYPLRWPWISQRINIC